MLRPFASLMPQSLHEMIGDDGFTRLVSAFYRQIPEDDILGPIYPADDLAGAEQRLRDFLIFRFGGSPRYIEQRGHPRLRQRHLPFPVDQQARDRWISLMERALAETQLPAQAGQMLGEFFSDTATFMMNRR